jgi:uncharacterized protein (TIGR00270 family)
MCGKGGNLVSADVEGVELRVCSGCSKYGKVKKKVFVPRQGGFRSSPVKRDVPEFRLVSNCAFLIKKARESRGMSQEDFSKFLNEKESIVAKWESGVMRPRLSDARKLSKILNVSLVQVDEAVDRKKEEKKASGTLTLGDMIKIKKRK